MEITKLFYLFVQVNHRSCFKEKDNSEQKNKKKGDSVMQSQHYLHGYIYLWEFRKTDTHICVHACNRFYQNATMLNIPVYVSIIFTLNMQWSYSMHKVKHHRLCKLFLIPDS